jgi:hypothetical protein
MYYYYYYYYCPLPTTFIENEKKQEGLDTMSQQGLFILKAREPL